ncbi:TetR/AcrR family transcriptional regulator [uncultured Maricaulis sp.]|uniref:TetR/AcrR family transcriptional regulator n=1 Tax=uncultured Maricaulis sp. TaxID=174710 RepID=UPI0030D897ED|tara:strand:- start:28300 stop:28956 length:657 start_codon:yes stop_codon:yes gene_type:complete
MSQGVRPAQQSRSRQTRAKLVAALEELLRQRSFEDISIADLAAEAGLSVGTVYRRFDNRDALIPVIFELYAERVAHYAAAPSARLTLEEGAGLRTALRQMVSLAWRFLTAEAHLVRAAHLYARLRPDLVGEEWEAFLEASVAQSEALIEHFSAEVSVPNRRHAAEILTYLFNTSLIERALYPQDGPAFALTMSDAVFTAAMADAIYGYLTAPDVPVRP